MQNKKAYFKMKNKQGVNIRFNAEERSALEIQMEKEDWEKVSTYIKYRLGLLGERDQTAHEIIHSGKPRNIVILIKNVLTDLVEEMKYYNSNYASIKKEIAQNNEAQTRKIIETTLRTNARINSLFNHVLGLLVEIAKALGIKDEIYNFPSLPAIDVRNPVKKDLDAAADQLFLQNKLKTNKP